MATPRRGLNADKDSIICKAINQRRLLAFTYHELPRVVAPYCHGISRREVEVFRGIQVGGSSSSGGLRSGKLWSVAEVANLRMLDESFVADDPNYNPDDSAMKHIHCRI